MPSRTMRLADLLNSPLQQVLQNQRPAPATATVASYTPPVSQRVGARLGDLAARVGGDRYWGTKVGNRLADVLSFIGVDAPGQIMDARQQYGVANSNGDRAAILASAMLAGADLAPGVGKAKRLGDVVDAATDARRGIVAYHSSPHDFERFSMDRIGTGGGANRFGRGLYFSDNEAFTKPFRQAGGATGPGHTYEVNLDLAPDEILNWDAPGWEQPEAVKRLMREQGIEVDAPVPQIRETASGKFTALNQWGERIGTYADRAKAERASLDAMGGGQRGAGGYLYSRLGGNPLYPELDKGDATQKLREAGVKAVKYSEAANIEGGADASHYVVFDDRLITILKKYGWVPGTVIPAALMAQAQSELDAKPGERIAG